MKQFSKIFKFEFKNYLTNKVFVGVTLVFMVLIIGVMFFPRISDAIGSGGDAPSGELPTMLIADKNGNEALIYESFAAAFTDYKVQSVGYDIDFIKEKIISGEVQCAIVTDGFTSFTYYVNNLSMYDVNTAIASEVMQNLYRVNSMIGGGLSPEDASGILSYQISSTTETLGVDQMQNYFYTYVMIMALYMVIILYGQMVATNVATEKSSRAMELLVTSAKPVSMMFGKVLSSCLAGFLQLVAIFGTAFISFNLNRSYWESEEMIGAIFDIPPELLVYMLIFFVLGFLIYAFLYGAIGSTASKLEDINTSVMPVTLVYIAAFMIVLFSITDNNVDSTLMKASSFIPFTSPMAMFARIAMSTVPTHEIVISIALLALSVVGVGYVSAKIYRTGVLLYGTPPKLGTIIKTVFKA
ncbi:MAG: ABC transporter permease [Ruminococcaceae bacterium]|nr:ABC transporter permease [Oscillospiraceae bacterium]